MADVYTVNRALINAGTLPLAQGEYGGEVKTLLDTYTVVGTIATGSTITGVKLPDGARVIGIKLIHPDMCASTATIDVGDRVDDNRYYDDHDISSASTTDTILQASIGHKVAVPDSTTGVPADDAEIVITLTSGAVLTPGTTLTMIIFYV